MHAIGAPLLALDPNVLRTSPFEGEGIRIGFLGRLGGGVIAEHLLPPDATQHRSLKWSHEIAQTPELTEPLAVADPFEGGTPDEEAMEVQPPSRVRVTTKRPSTGTRHSSFTAGTNQAVSGSRGCTATANPKVDGPAFSSSCQETAPSVERKMPLWCCAHSTSGLAWQRTMQWGSWIPGSFKRPGGM